MLKIYENWIAFHILYFSVFNQNSYVSSGIAPVNDLNTVTYSSKHDALYLYFARLIRPIWKMRCVDENLNSKLTHLDCKYILKDLYSLKNFLEANSVNDLSCELYYA